MSWKKTNGAERVLVKSVDETNPLISGLKSLIFFRFKFRHARDDFSGSARILEEQPNRHMWGVLGVEC
jgi:hypothetical protein